jgi:hypothetical protein
MYHVELRQFPHNFCRFNLSERELRQTILNAWAHGEWIELGERKWSPHQASLTVLEGPQLPVEQLSMGRGWRNAGRQGRDVTEQLLATVRRAVSTSGGVRPTEGVGASSTVTSGRQSPTGRPADQATTQGLDSAFDVRLAADSLSLEVLAKLGTQPQSIATVWLRARERYDECPASDCLMLAEHAIRSLAAAGLVVVLTANESGKHEPCVSEEQLQHVLMAVDSWVNGGDSAVLFGRAQSS